MDEFKKTDAGVPAAATRLKVCQPLSTFRFQAGEHWMTAPAGTGVITRLRKTNDSPTEGWGLTGEGIHLTDCSRSGVRFLQHRPSPWITGWHVPHRISNRPRSCRNF